MKKWTLVLGLFFLSSVAYAQGLPPFGTLEPGQVDTLNLQNLNESVFLPITSGQVEGLVSILRLLTIPTSGPMRQISGTPVLLGMVYE